MSGMQFYANRVQTNLMHECIALRRAGYSVRYIASMSGLPEYVIRHWTRSIGRARPSLERTRRYR